MREDKDATATTISPSSHLGDQGEAPFWISPVELGDIELELTESPSLEGIKAKLRRINSGVGPI